jgi:hypothetical protein
LLTKTTFIDASKAAAGLASLRPSDAQIVELSVRGLRNARRVLEMAKADASAANETAVAALRAAGLRTAEFALQAGIDLRATLSEPSGARQFDVSKVPADLLAKVTVPKVDTKKWDAAVELGLVPADVVAAVVSHAPSKDNVVLTEHAAVQA